MLKQQFSGMKWHDPYLGDYLYNDPSKMVTLDIWITQNYPLIRYRKFKNESEMTLNAATSLFNNKIIAWAHGRCEAGPRALGNRSLLANPCNPKTKDIVNAKIKHREFWRPFAPICLLEDTDKWFKLDHEQSFMLESPEATHSAKEIIPAVIHYDNTGRVQTVSRRTNSLLYNLLKDFKSIKGIGVLLNTSLNGPSQSIYNDLRDILNLLRDTELDLAYVGNYKFWKDSNA